MANAHNSVDNLEPTKVAFVVKNPSKCEDFRLSVPLEATLAELQQLIAQGYEGQPEPSSQTVCLCLLCACVRRLSCGLGARGTGGVRPVGRKGRRRHGAARARAAPPLPHKTHGAAQTRLTHNNPKRHNTNRNTKTLSPNS